MTADHKAGSVDYEAVQRAKLEEEKLLQQQEEMRMQLERQRLELEEQTRQLEEMKM